MMHHFFPHEKVSFFTLSMRHILGAEKPHGYSQEVKLAPDSLTPQTLIQTQKTLMVSSFQQCCFRLHFGWISTVWVHQNWHRPEQRRSITGRLRCISQEGGPGCQLRPPYGAASSHQKPLLPSPRWPPSITWPQIAKPITGKWSMQRQYTYQTTFILCLHPPSKGLL